MTDSSADSLVPLERSERSTRWLTRDPRLRCPLQVGNMSSFFPHRALSEQNDAAERQSK